MKNEQAITYLQENKGRFSQEMLVEQLRKSGYPEADITESISYVFSSVSSKDGNVAQQASPRRNFWDFTSVHVYQSSAEKIQDTFFGFFAPILLFVVPLVAVPFDIFLLAYFWRRRRFIAYGVLGRWAFSFCTLFIVGVMLSRAF